jgi:tetratricopeptide (TPR) repeat protein
MRIVPLILAAGLCCGTVAWAQSGGATSKKPAGKPAAAAPKKYDEAQLAALEARLAKSPKDARLIAETAEANYQVGYAAMVNPDLPPRTKYPAALKRFRRALALNPKHVKAARDKKQIEDIYTQMGRPIPE